MQKEINPIINCPLCCMNWYSLGIIRSSLRIRTVVRATSHLSLRLTAMHVTVNGVSSHLCKILTPVIIKTYLQALRRPYSIARRPIVTCYNSVKPPETSKSVRKPPKTHSFSAGRTSRDGLYNWDNANFSSNVFWVKIIMHNIFRIKRIGYHQ